MKNTVQSLENYYKVDIHKIIEMYKQGMSLNEMVNTGITTNMRLRNILAVLNLRLKQKFRKNDIQILEARLAEDTKEYTSELIDNLTSDLSVVQRELQKNSKTIQLLRDNNTALRKTLREANRTEGINDRIINALNTHLSELEPDTIHLNVVPESEDGTTILVLSDIHYGEVITADSTNNYNVYNEEICIERLKKVIQKVCTVNWRTDSLRVYLLGDILNGGIHSGDLKAESPIMLGVVNFSKQLGTLLNGLSKVFKDIEVIMVNGNHSRITDIQKTYQKAYDYEFILYHMLKELVPHIPMSYNTSGYTIDDINGHSIGLFHGDTMRSYNGEVGVSAYKIQNIIETAFNVKVRSLISGHTHKPKVVANPFGGFNIVNGCLSGVSEYGLTTGFDTIYPSQTIARMDSDGEFQEILQVRV